MRSRSSVRILLFAFTASYFGIVGMSQTTYVNDTFCDAKNATYGLFPISPGDTQEHSNGYHAFLNTMSGSCSYTGTASTQGTVGCSLDSKATSQTVSSRGTLYSETGSVMYTRTHYPSINDAQGEATANGGLGAISNSEGAVAITSCVGSCALTGISFTGSGNGASGGFTVNFTGSPLWKNQKPYQNSCAGYTLNKVSTGSSCPYPIGSPPYSPETGYSWGWSTTTCNWQQYPNNSPLIVDTTNTGFKFSDPRKGDYVSFDIRGNGVLQKVSWPLPDSGNAWLAYDRDGDGIIKDGTELFGNFTPHADGGVPNHPNPNGFLALQWYDHPEQGGHSDLMIDKLDPIWQKLRLWIDTHCYKTPDAPCHSLPQELHTLESVNINSISLIYQGDQREDEIGNDWKFYSYANPRSHGVFDEYGNQDCCNLHQQSKDGRRVYDVYLKTVVEPN
jgi:hypothetical protein